MTAKENEKLFFEWLASTSPKKNDVYKTIFPELDAYCKSAGYYKSSIFSIIDPKKVVELKGKIEDYSDAFFSFSFSSQTFSLYQSALSLYKDYLRKEFIPKYRAIRAKEKLEKEAEPTESIMEPIIKAIEQEHLSYIDKRPSGGCLWIIADKGISNFIADCKVKGYIFKYKPEGSNCSKGKPCWWLDVAASKKIQPNTEENMPENEMKSCDDKKNPDADPERAAFDELLSDIDYQPLKEALLRMGIQTIPSLKSITLWNFMNNRNLYSIATRMRICKEIESKLRPKEEAAQDSASFIIKAWEKEFSGATPSLAFASFLSEYAEKFPLKFRSRIGNVHVQTNRIVVYKYAPAGVNVLKLNGGNGFVADDLTPELVKTYVDWIQQRSGTNVEAQYELIQPCSEPEQASDEPYQAQIPENVIPVAESISVSQPAPIDPNLVKAINVLVEKADLNGILFEEVYSKLSASRNEINRTVASMKDILEIGPMLYHRDSFVDFDEAADTLESILEKLMKDNNGYVSASELYKYARASMQMFLNDNDIQTQDMVFGIAKYLFEKLQYHERKYSFNKLLHISLPEDAVNSNLSLALKYARENGPTITYQEIESYLNKMGLKTGNLRNQLKICIEPKFLIYGDNEYISAESIGIDDAYLGRIKDALKKLFNDAGEHIILRRISNSWLSMLPPLPGDLSWTPMLLQQIVYFYGESLQARTIPAKSGQDLDTLHAMLVNRDSWIQDFRDAVATLLEEEQRGKDHFETDELRAVLLNAGMIQGGELWSSLPKALAGDPRFIWSSNGTSVTVRI